MRRFLTLLTVPALLLSAGCGSEVNVLDMGATGDGVTDDSPAINACLEKGGKIYIPAGTYMIGSTLMIGSDTHLICAPEAHLKIMSGAQKGPEDFLLSCRKESENITVEGGIWDGNCSGNDRGDDLFNTDATTGTMLNFDGVKGLKLLGMHLRNPLCYNVRFCHASDVEIGNVTLDSDVIISNQDGFHFVGYCEDFLIHDIIGTAGSPNDDFLAFNADDCITRQENFGIVRGPIRNFEIRNIHSDECYCFIRILSCESEISHIHIDGVTGQCISTFLNMDAARYCRTPVFKEEDYPCGVGNVSDILIENVNVTARKHRGPALVMETNADNFEIHNFSMAKDTAERIRFRNVDGIDLKVSGLTGVSATEDADILSGNFEKTLSHADTLQFRCMGFESLVISKAE